MRKRRCAPRAVQGRSSCCSSQLCAGLLISTNHCWGGLCGDLVALGSESSHRVGCEQLPVTRTAFCIHLRKAGFDIVISGGKLLKTVEILLMQQLAVQGILNKSELELKGAS